MIRNLRPQASSHDSLIELFSVDPFLNQKLGNLSGGTKQKVNLILTFMFDSPLIILDEPTTGLDPVSLLHLKQIIRNEQAKGKTILFTSHIMNFVEEMANEIVFLLDGKIYFRGSPEDMKKQTDEPDLEHAIANLLENQLA
jgi:Cu-processing system ATP-binding protein